MSEKKARFKQVLDECHEWPCSYIFKFIVPSENLTALTNLFPDHEYATRESKNGKYTSVTIEAVMNSGNDVMVVYEQAAQVPGVMSL